MSTAGEDRLVGKTIDGKFVIEMLLGGGAMGSVYSARHIDLDKRVAIKVMHQGIAGDPLFVARFKREAKAASRLDHPNSIRVLDSGQDDSIDGGLLYIAMELLEGRDLFRVLNDEWPLAPRRIVDILSQTLSALAAAHDLGIVHRDLKPENIMVKSTLDDEGMQIDIVKVCDFGIAKINDPRAFQTGAGKAPLTMTGAVVGTPEYMSPEQGKGDSLDFRSDLYSVGVILFHMLTGRVPFLAETAIGIILKHITEEPPLPASIYAGVDPTLESICMHALQKNREKRFQGAREMRQALRRAYADLPRPSRAPHHFVSSASPIATAATILDSQSVIDSAVSHTVKDKGLFAPTALPIATQIEPKNPKNASLSPPKKNRGATAALFGLALATGIGVTIATFYFQSSRSHTASETMTASASATAPPEVTLQTIDPLQPLAVPKPSIDSQPTIAMPSSSPSSLHPAPFASHAAALLAAKPSASASAIAIASVPAPSAVPVVSPPPTSTPAAAGPPLDPSHAWVEIGMVNAPGTPDGAVSLAVRRAQLASCYQDGLRERGASFGGPASVSISIDASGAIRSAIVMGATFSQAMNRCVQSRLQAQKVNKVDSAATGEVWLTFHPQ